MPLWVTQQDDGIPAEQVKIRMLYLPTRFSRNFGHGFLTVAWPPDILISLISELLRYASLTPSKPVQLVPITILMDTPRAILHCPSSMPKNVENGMAFIVTQDPKRPEKIKIVTRKSCERIVLNLVTRKSS
jgi:hypothetical protein